MVFQCIFLVVPRHITCCEMIHKHKKVELWFNYGIISTGIRKEEREDDARIAKNFTCK